MDNYIYLKFSVEKFLRSIFFILFTVDYKNMYCRTFLQIRKLLHNLNYLQYLNKLKYLNYNNYISPILITQHSSS